MESTDTLTARLADFKSALNTLQLSLQLDLGKYNNVELDTVKSGQIQKFEYCTELCWKTVKIFLAHKHGIDTISPKTTIKEFYRISLIDDKNYELLIQMLDDRNRLSHIYNELFFEDIYLKLDVYFKVMKKVLDNIS